MVRWVFVFAMVFLWVLYFFDTDVDGVSFESRQRIATDFVEPLRLRLRRSIDVVLSICSVVCLYYTEAYLDYTLNQT